MSSYHKLVWVWLCWTGWPLLQIQNPTTIMIARTAVAHDNIAGMEQLPLSYSLTSVVMDDEPDKEILKMVARTTLRTKLYEALADQLTDIVVNAVLCIRKPEEATDLFMVEIMHMRHKFDVDTRLVEGLVLDHGSRHPDMKRIAENCYILTCNVSLEYEKSEINAGFFYLIAEQRETMVAAERRSVDERVRKIIKLKDKVCSGNDNNFVVINQRGIDPPSLDLLVRVG
ncbi:T-complex protein 1 subunit zeta 1 [Camellia lanceoleosa]|uniref:T-complex protein 1 subunit zeta 1 n=1 Tax=Camellia lanceoleosa TaxID=1840588 RepID=A0ACC0J2J1_9ERIC|nr:T-complex protein 1 subunit zeta 1 [Camellia lanceoleosa]